MLSSKLKRDKETRSGNCIYFILVLGIRDCFQQNLTKSANFAMKTAFVIQLRPRNDGSVGNVTFLGHRFNVSVRLNRSPYIHSRHCTNPGLAYFERSSHCFLVLSNNCGTSASNQGSLLKARAIPDYFSIDPEFIISVFVVPCETDMVK